MARAKILLGKLKANIDSIGAGELIYLEKHEWDCDWYYAFGYLGNRNLHFHFESFLNTEAKTASELFISTKITDNEWWTIRDLFKQAYALKNAAEVYQHGGHQSSLPGVTDILKSKDKADALNKDLKIILDVLWDFVVKACNK